MGPRNYSPENQQGIKQLQVADGLFPQPLSIEIAPIRLPRYLLAVTLTFSAAQSTTCCCPQVVVSGVAFSSDEGKRKDVFFTSTQKYLRSVLEH